MIIAIIILCGVAGAMLSLLFKVLKKPMSWILKFLIHAVMGYIFLFIFDFVGAWFDLSLGLNWLNAAVTGLLGVPGVLLLLALKYLVV